MNTSEIFKSWVHLEQLESEITSFYKFLGDFPIKTYLEIGTYGGGTMLLMSHFLPEHANLISIDINPNCPYPEIHHLFPNKMQLVRYITGDSHSITTLNMVKDVLRGTPVDLLFIDGNHFEADQDFEMYSKLVRRNGIIAFHDINPGPKENVGTVPEYWQKLKQNYTHYEFVAGDPKGYGIGIIRYV